MHKDNEIVSWIDGLHDQKRYGDNSTGGYGECIECGNDRAVALAQASDFLKAFCFECRFGAEYLTTVCYRNSVK
jgi:hypothetical protein